MSIEASIFGNSWELKDRYIPNHKRLAKLVSYWKNMGLRIVLTSGTYDIIHIGHLEYLGKAKKTGDILIVAVDSDEKVKKKKGPDRPVVPEEERLGMLPFQRPVDVITIKNVNDPKFHILKIIRPDVLIISETSKHSKSDIRKMKKFCGKIKLLPPQAETSTTAKIRHLHIGGAKKFADELMPKFISLIEDALKKLDGGEK